MSWLVLDLFQRVNVPSGWLVKYRYARTMIFRDMFPNVAFPGGMDRGWPRAFPFYHRWAAMWGPGDDSNQNTRNAFLRNAAIRNGTPVDQVYRFYVNGFFPSFDPNYSQLGVSVIAQWTEVEMPVNAPTQAEAVSQIPAAHRMQSVSVTNGMPSFYPATPVMIPNAFQLLDVTPL